MNPLSHALHLTLKLSHLEAVHGGAPEITPDHLFLGLLKLVDTDLSSYTKQLSELEQQSTRDEIDALRRAFASIDTTRTRRALRRQISSGHDEYPDAISPIPCPEYKSALLKLSWSAGDDTCMRLLEILLSFPSSALESRLKDEGLTSDELLASRRKASPGAKDAGFGSAIVNLQLEWQRRCPGLHPDLSECWRRLSKGLLVEFDDQGGLKILQGEGCLLHVKKTKMSQLETLMGKSLGSALLGFQEDSAERPMRVPLSEF